LRKRTNIKVIQKRGKKGFWKKQVRSYYEKRRGITKLILQTIKEHGLPGIPAANLPSAIQKVKDVVAGEEKSVLYGVPFKEPALV